MEWQVSEVVGTEGFFDLLQSSAQPAPTATLDPILLRKATFSLALAQNPFFIESTDYEQQVLVNKAGCRRFATIVVDILRLCVNLRVVRLGDALFTPSIEVQQLLQALSNLPSLKILRITGLHLSLTTYAYLTASQLQFLAVNVFEYGVSEAITLPPIQATKTIISFVGVSTNHYSALAHQLFPSCEDLQLRITTGLDATVIADSLSLLNNQSLAIASIRYTIRYRYGGIIDELVLPERLPHGFGGFSFVIQENIGEMGELYVGRWSSKIMRDNLSKFEDAIGDVRVRMGDDFGRDEERLVLEEAAKWGKMVMWV